MKSTLVALAIATLSGSAMAQSVNQFYGEAMYDTVSIKDTSSTQLRVSGILCKRGES